MPIVRVTKTFRYRDAVLEEGKIYDFRNVPEGFVSHWIVNGQRGEILNELKKGTEVLPDPRFPEKDKVAAELAPDDDKAEGEKPAKDDAKSKPSKEDVKSSKEEEDKANASKDDASSPPKDDAKSSEEDNATSGRPRLKTS